ncbi:hypothetical protein PHUNDERSTRUCK_40 [Escherichia phage vB_EcoD_Phunderstruck]|jgi:hypothetical protein|nr:hypothetical protein PHUNDERSTRUCK_40 [Escherichia phage vB_EcoD_Phunderstruck]
MSSKFLVVRVYNHDNGSSAEIPTIYDRGFGWSEQSAVENERKIAEMYGDTCSIEVRQYDESNKPTNETHMWPDA